MDSLDDHITPEELKDARSKEIDFMDKFGVSEEAYWQGLAPEAKVLDMRWVDVRKRSNEVRSRLGLPRLSAMTCAQLRRLS